MMQVRFARNFLPLADMFITQEQRPFVTFAAHFNFVMLHELAHGLGPKYTINNNGLVKDAMKDLNHVIEEGKAELLALFLMNKLQRWGYVSQNDLRDVTVTSLVKLLYNGDSRQSIIWLNFFKEQGAYTRDNQTGTYRVNFAQFETAVNTLAEQFLQIQVNGDYEVAKAFVEQYGRADEALQHDNERIDAANLPFGLLVEQGQMGWPTTTSPPSFMITMASS
jgi:hypothetical protein